MKLNKDLVAAYAAPLILSILEDGESYGYAILERVRTLSGGAVEWTDGMLYPVLHRLEANGYVALKAAGRAALTDQKEQWRVAVRMLGQLWGGLTWKTTKG